MFLNWQAIRSEATDLETFEARGVAKPAGMPEPATWGELLDLMQEFPGVAYYEYLRRDFLRSEAAKVFGPRASEEVFGQD